MRTFREQNRLIGTLVFLITCFVYIRTVAPTVTFWDTGEFIAASYILGVPHPPGAPFHTLLGRIFTLFVNPDNVAFSVNLISVLAGATTALLLYLCSVRLLTRWLRPDRMADRIAILTGAAVAALSAAFSTSFWANATEAEVYALSMLFTVLAFYLALRWDGAPEDRYRDRLLIFIVYLFFLGAGVHLQCLLTVPGILILVFSDLLKDRSTSVQATVVIGLTVFPFLCIISPLSVTVVLVLAVLAALLVWRPAWRHPAFLLCAVGTIVLGYSTYVMLYIRSGLDPFVDMNNPETLENFKAFLTRQQYGVHSIFPRRGEFWTYQLNIHVKYFLQQFPFYDQGLVGRFFSETLPAFTERFSVGAMLSGTFRRAVATMGDNRETIAYSVVPILLGIGGAVSHFRRDWKRFASIFAMFLLMGLGLVLYLNMPDPEPREREYIFRWRLHVLLPVDRRRRRCPHQSPSRAVVPRFPRPRWPRSCAWCVPIRPAAEQLLRTRPQRRLHRTRLRVEHSEFLRARRHPLHQRRQRHLSVVVSPIRQGVSPGCPCGQPQPAQRRRGTPNNCATWTPRLPIPDDECARIDSDVVANYHWRERYATLRLPPIARLSSRPKTSPSSNIPVGNRRLGHPGIPHLHDLVPG